MRLISNLLLSNPRLMFYRSNILYAFPDLDDLVTLLASRLKPWVQAPTSIISKYATLRHWSGHIFTTRTPCTLVVPSPNSSVLLQRKDQELRLMLAVTAFTNLLPLRVMLAKVLWRMIGKWQIAHSDIWWLSSPGNWDTTNNCNIPLSRPSISSQPSTSNIPS